MISKFQRSLSWNVWVLHTVEQSCLTCYHFKWGKPKTQMPSKLCQKIGYGKTFLHINNFHFFLLLPFNKSVKVLWIIAKYTILTEQILFGSRNLSMSRRTFIRLHVYWALTMAWHVGSCGHSLTCHGIRNTLNCLLLFRVFFFLLTIIMFKKILHTNVKLSK